MKYILFNLLYVKILKYERFGKFEFKFKFKFVLG